MAGRDLFADEAQPQRATPQPVSGGRDLFAAEPVIPQPIQPVAQPRPSMDELYQKFRSGQMSPGAASAFQELAIRRMGTPQDVMGISGGTQFKTATGPEDEFGAADYIMGLLEPAATIATGAIAEPIAGIAGSVAGAIPGEEGQAARTVESVQEALTYMPKTRGGMASIQAIGEAISPIAEVAGRVSGAVGEAGYKIGGPIGGAAAVTMLHAIPELLGLKGTRVAKKAMLKKVVSGQDIAGLYDELGNLLPEIQDGLRKSGIDISEVEDILPQTRTEEVIRKSAEELGEAATKRIGAGVAQERIAQEIKPSKEILDAAKEFGLESQLLPSHYSENPVFRALEQGLKSIPASQLSMREKTLLADLGKRADDLITEFGGTLDKSTLSDQFRTKSINMITELEEKASKAYDDIAESVPGETPISAKNILGWITSETKTLGGAQYIDANERRLLKSLSPESKPTYARLDKLRKEIGAGIKGSGKFKDVEQGRLKNLYGMLSEDQKIAAKKAGFGDLYDSATELIIARKGIEKQIVGSLGKDLAGSVSAKAGPAILDLQKGNTKRFDDLIDSIPDAIGQEAKREIIATSLNDAFTQGSRAEKSLNVAGFDDFMNGLKKNKASRSRLVDQLGKDAVKRLETLHIVVSGVRRAQKDAITTGRIMAVPGMMDEQRGLTSRLFGGAAKVAAAEGVTTAVGMPGVGTTGVLVKALASSKTKRSIAADELLASHKFQKILNRKASGRLDTESKIKSAEQTLEKLKEYQNWKNSIPDRDIKDLIAVGSIGYLTGESAEENK